MQQSLDLDISLPKKASTPPKGPEMPTVYAFTDGACSGNPGPGGWAYVLKGLGPTIEKAGGAKQTTNNRMELSAALNVLRDLPSPSTVHLTTDSQYVLKGYTEWLPNWRRKGWKNSQGKPVENRDLWEELHAAGQRHKITWHWVRGHQGHPENERCDELAVAAIPKP